MALTDGVRDNTAVVAQQVLAAAVFERQYNFARFPTFDAFPAEATDVSEFLAGSRHIVRDCLTFAARRAQRACGPLHALLGGAPSFVDSLASSGTAPAEARKSD